MLRRTILLACLLSVLPSAQAATPNWGAFICLENTYAYFDVQRRLHLQILVDAATPIGEVGHLDYYVTYGTEQVLLSTHPSVGGAMRPYSFDIVLPSQFDNWNFPAINVTVELYKHSHAYCGDLKALDISDVWVD